jgi:uncharacterized protein (TIRG00374 family)
VNHFVIHHFYRYGKQFIKLLVSGGLIVFLYVKLENPDIRHVLLNLDAKVVSLCVSSMVVLIAVQGIRWKIVVHALGISVSLKESIALSFIGAIFSQVLPSSAGGDTIRVYRLFRSGFPLGLSVHSVLIDRILALVGLVLLSAIGFGLLGWSEVPVSLLAALGVFAMAIVSGIAVLLCLDRIPLPGIITKLHIVRKVMHISAHARSIFLHPFIVLITISISILTHLGTSGVFWLFGTQVGLQADFLVCVAIVPLVALAMTIPLSVAGWGVREGAMVFAFSAIGGNSAAAMLASILFGVATACASLPGVLFWHKDTMKPPI